MTDGSPDNIAMTFRLVNICRTREEILCFLYRRMADVTMLLCSRFRMMRINREIITIFIDERKSDLIFETRDMGKCLIWVSDGFFMDLFSMFREHFALRKTVLYLLL